MEIAEDNEPTLDANNKAWEREENSRSLSVTMLQRKSSGSGKEVMVTRSISKKSGGTKKTSSGKSSKRVLDESDRTLEMARA